MAESVAPRARPHYAWAVAAVTFVTLLATAGVRATPGVLIVPLEREFGWSRATISAAIAVNLVLYGLIGPFAAAIMDRLGLRRTILASLAVAAAGVAATTVMREPWQLVLLWGVVVGAGTGTTALVLAVSTPITTPRRSANQRLTTVAPSTATGQLVFLPLLAAVVERTGWRAAVVVVAVALGIVWPLVLLFMRDRPSDMALAPYGGPRRRLHAAGALCLLAAALAIGRRGPARNRWNVTGATATTA